MKYEKPGDDASKRRSVMDVTSAEKSAEEINEHLNELKEQQTQLVELARQMQEANEAEENTNPSAEEVLAEKNADDENAKAIKELEERRAELNIYKNHFPDEEAELIAIDGKINEINEDEAEGGVGSGAGDESLYWHRITGRFLQDVANLLESFRRDDGHGLKDYLTSVYRVSPKQVSMTAGIINPWEIPDFM